MSREALVPLLEVLKERAFVKNGIRSYKCKLFNSHSKFIKKLKHVYLHSEDLSSLVDVQLSVPCAPLGGAWGQASFVIVKVPEEVKFEQGQWLSCLRSELPSLQGGEYYLSDLLGLEVVDENNVKHGLINGFYFDQNKADSPVNLRIIEGEKEFECPEPWVEQVQLESKTVLIPSVSQWKI